MKLSVTIPDTILALFLKVNWQAVEEWNILRQMSLGAELRSLCKKLPQTNNLVRDVAGSMPTVIAKELNSIDFAAMTPSAIEQCYDNLLHFVSVNNIPLL